MLPINIENLNKIRQQSIETIKKLKKPKLLLILSGKRKSGKDFVEQLLLEKYPNKILSFRISAPIKYEFAKQNNLNYEELLSSSRYKESYRKQMVEWSESIRANDANYFLRLTIIDSYRKNNGENRPIWILNDARRECDLQYFDDQNEIQLNDNKCKIIKVRIETNDMIRMQRGWIFTAGIDDQQTECGLDNYQQQQQQQQWNYIIENNGNRNDLIQKLSETIFKEIDQVLSVE